jgi:hypothetical protein
MHPEILRELQAQRRHDLQQEADLARLVRTLRALRRNRRQAASDEFVVPAIPDYVDGSFRTTGDEAAAEVPAARHAA